MQANNNPQAPSVVSKPNASAYNRTSSPIAGDLLFAVAVHGHQQKLRCDSGHHFLSVFDVLICSKRLYRAPSTFLAGLNVSYRIIPR